MTERHANLCNTLHRSPFYVLGASVRDGRKRIVELADERSLVADADLCAKTRGNLTNPRTRLAAEIAWLPGLSPNAARVLIENLSNHAEMLKRASSAAALAKANLMAAAIGFLARARRRMSGTIGSSPANPFLPLSSAICDQSLM